MPLCRYVTAGEAALKSAQLELQLQTRKQEAEVEMVQAKLQQQAAALVSMAVSIASVRQNAELVGPPLLGEGGQVVAYLHVL